jgi:hypothetical protein
MRIRVLDLFCGAGGCSVGYHRAFTKAGYEVEITGVDIKNQPRYPFRFVQGDAITFDLSVLQKGDTVPADIYVLSLRNGDAVTWHVAQSSRIGADGVRLEVCDPMAATLWSMPAMTILTYPAKSVISPLHALGRPDTSKLAGMELQARNANHRLHKKEQAA